MSETVWLAYTCSTKEPNKLIGVFSTKRKATNAIDQKLTDTQYTWWSSDTGNAYAHGEPHLNIVAFVRGTKVK